MESLENLMASLLGPLLIIAIIVLVVVLIVYIFVSIFLNKFNDLVEGEKTIRAWLPVFNIYLLGKLAFNKLVGWILVILTFAQSILTGTTTVTVNGEEHVSQILTGNANKIVKVLYSVIILAVFGYAVVKYEKLKKEEKQGLTSSSEPTETPVTEPVMETPVEQPVTEPAVPEQLAEQPVETPVMETPVEQPVVVPVMETPVEQPVVAPVMEAPVEQPVAEQPTTEQNNILQ